MSCVRAEEAEEFFVIVEQRRVSQATLKALRGLSLLRPEWRLKRNANALLDRLARGQEGLYTDTERVWLAELSVCRVPGEVQQVAYKLLNTYERYQLEQALSGLFRRARTQTDDPAGRRAEDV
jgi:hypothetical protein